MKNKFKSLIGIIVVLSIIFGVFNMFNSKSIIEKKYKEFAYLDHPDAAAFRDYIMMVDPNLGRIPFERYPIAMQKTELQKSANRSVNAINWTQVSCDMGGRTKAFALDPNDATHKKVWAGTATGGLWYNNDITNANSPWIAVGDVWQSLSISSICFDPNNPLIMYVGTGESETAITNIYRESSGRGYGIWKSTDGGQTFNRLSSTSDFAYVSDIAIKNENGTSVIYAGVLSGLYRGGVFNSLPSDGLYRSADAGLSWTQVLPNIQGGNQPYTPSDIEITTNGKIYVGTKRNFDGQGAACILSSTTGLSGSWQVNTQYQTAIQSSGDYNIPARVKLASAPSNPNVVYALIAAKSNNSLLSGFPTTEAKYLVKTTNNGNSWQYKTLPDGGQRNFAYLAWHAFSIKVDPNNENRVFAGGLDVHLSSNGGQTWQKISDWAAMYGGGGNDYVHADIHLFTFLGNSSKLAIVSDGGVFYTSNANQSNIIFQKRNKAFATLQFYSIAISEGLTNDYMGGLQDNGTVLFDNHPLVENDMVDGGDGAFCAFDTDTPSMLIATTYNNSFFVYDRNGGYDRANLNSGTFITTFDYDSQNNTIWANACDEHGVGADQVAKIYDITSGIQWQTITMNTGATLPFTAVRLVNSNTLLLGTSDGKIFRVNNIIGSPVATQIDQGALPTGFVSSIQTQNNGNTILITMSNYGIQSVWQSIDGGNNWQNVSGNLPDMPIRWAIYHPQNINRVMLATETGVWVSNNINAANVVWNPQNTGLPNVRVDMLDIRTRDNTVIAGTHGRAMFTCTWNNTSDIDDVNPNLFKIYPNPTTDFIQINSNQKDNILCKIINMSGKVVLNKIINCNEKIDVRELSKGVYIVKISKGNLVEEKKLIIQ